MEGRMLGVMMLRVASALLAAWMDKASRAVMLAAVVALGLLGARAWWIGDGLQRAEVAAQQAVAAAQLTAVRERERIESEIAAQRARDDAALAEAERREQEAKRNVVTNADISPAVVHLDSDWLRRERARSGGGR
jgi:hypothetical protein